MCNCDFGKGLRVEHCTACHATFSGTTAGDLHRTGKHHIFTGPDRRRCLRPDEMLAKGMTQNASGVWMTPSQDWIDTKRVCPKPQF